MRVLEVQNGKWRNARDYECQRCMMQVTKEYDGESWNVRECWGVWYEYSPSQRFLVTRLWTGMIRKENSMKKWLAWSVKKTLRSRVYDECHKETMDSTRAYEKVGNVWWGYRRSKMESMTVSSDILIVNHWHSYLVIHPDTKLSRAQALQCQFQFTSMNEPLYS